MPGTRSPCLLVAVVLWGCGDSTHPVDAAGPDSGADESGLGDSGVGDAPDGSDAQTGRRIGETCPNGDECGPHLVCVDEEDRPDWPIEGLCTHQCTLDEHCPAGFVCTTSFPVRDDISGTNRICLPACGMDGSCADADRVCSTTIFGFRLVTPACIAGSASAFDGSPCESFADCAAGQDCFPPNPFDEPGGRCATPCSPTGDPCADTPAGDPTTCVGVERDAHCVQTCTADTDCTRFEDGHRCVDDTCVFPGGAAGAACSLDADCGPPPWRCVLSPTTPGGYCGASGCRRSVSADCPVGTRCHDPTVWLPASGDELCVVTCSDDADCPRIGYECLPVDPDFPVLRGCRVP